MTYISTVLDRKRSEVKVWARKDGKRVLKRFDAPYFFYVADEDGDYEDLYGQKLTRLDFDSFTAFADARKKLTAHGTKLYESDINPEYKVLSEQFYGAPIEALNVTLFDIEVDYDKKRGFSDPTNPYAPVSSVAIYHIHTGRTVVLVVPPKTRPEFKYKDLPEDITDGAEVTICKNEKELLNLFFEEIEDSDILSGWNSDQFDLPYIYERAKITLYKNAGNKLCFNPHEPYYRTFEMYGNEVHALVLKGRIGLDYLDLYKKFEMSLKPSYKLEAVAEDELEDLPKLDYEGSLYDLYHDNFEEFIRYNIRDTIILKGLEDKKKYIKLAIQMSHMATSHISDVLGTTKIAEMAILNHCHYEMDMRVPDTKEVMETGKKFDGATVLPPQAGMHDWVASLDLASLYPSTMRSLNISPETIVGQFTDGPNAFFAIKENSDEELIFTDEQTENSVQAPAYKFKKILKKQNWSISAAGTVFDLNKDGVIPSILATWFAERKAFKAEMKKINKELETLSETDPQVKKLKEKLEYFDRMQYIKKIQLNATYGSTGNKYFKFFDIRLAESTTLSGREVLYHMVRKVAEEISGNYDLEDDSIVYGDSVAGDSKVYTSSTDYVNIETLFTNVDDTVGDKEYCFTDKQVLTYDERDNTTKFKPIKYIMRHKANKQMYRVHVGNGNYVDVTEDHSIMGYKPNEVRLSALTPNELNNDIGVIVHSDNPLGFSIGDIIKIEKIEYDDYVYDIEVDDTHVFFANNILVHNTDSVYFKTYKENKEDAIKLANHLNDIVNDSYPEFMKDTFNCDEAHNDLMKSEQEIVSDKGIFISKKYYILHLVSDDGKEVDKIKDMGVPIKKTTLPKHIKVKLTSYIERLLKGEDWDIIGPEIVYFKDEIKEDSNITLLGLPKGINGLEAYTAKHNAKEPDVRYPGHVSASILWNKCLEKFEDKESPKIISGDKINIFYLKKPLGKFKSIAMPKDINIIPDWFMEEFVPLIDKDAQIERLIDKPMKIMISVAGIKVPTKKKLKFEEALFG